MELPEAVERVLQQFEAMAGAEDWYVATSLRTAHSPYSCPLGWLAFGQWHPMGDTITSAADALGLSNDEAHLIAGAADGDTGPLFLAVRERLLAAAGLA